MLLTQLQNHKTKYFQFINKFNQLEIKYNLTQIKFKQILINLTKILKIRNHLLMKPKTYQLTFKIWQNQIIHLIVIITVKFKARIKNYIVIKGKGLIEDWKIITIEICVLIEEFLAKMITSFNLNIKKVFFT